MSIWREAVLSQFDCTPRFGGGFVLPTSLESFCLKLLALFY